MKDFAEAYKAAHAKAREYMGAKRAGWAEPGKRTRENHAILIPRREAVDMANNLEPAGLYGATGHGGTRCHDMPGVWRHFPRWVDEWEMPIL